MFWQKYDISASNKAQENKQKIQNTFFFFRIEILSF